jgi:hypothetical protein
VASCPTQSAEGGLATPVWPGGRFGHTQGAKWGWPNHLHIFLLVFFFFDFEIVLIFIIFLFENMTLGKGIIEIF